MQSYPTTGAGAYEALDYVPTVAQWARAKALGGVTRVLGGSRVTVSQHDADVMENVIERWARYIETGKWDAEQ